MMNFFANLAFLNPWILAALTALPVLWFLLRITPPAPKLIRLPTTRFLAGLVPEAQTPDKTPWWILLLRLIIAALVITALAQPVYNPAPGLAGSGPLRLVIDNGWESAQSWNAQMDAAAELVSQAQRENREIYILGTAPEPGTDAPAAFGPLAPSQAGGILKGLAPLPWPPDYKAARAGIGTGRDAQPVTYWLSAGLSGPGHEAFAQALKSEGALFFRAPEAQALPLVLKQPEEPGYGLEIAVDAPEGLAPGVPVTVQALTRDGRVLDTQSGALVTGALPVTFTFDVPEILRNDISSFRIAGRSGAGAVFTLDDRFQKKSVGIAGPEDDSKTKPFIEAAYYLRRALEPYTSLSMGSVGDMVAKNPSVIILPDIGAMPATTLNALETWVRGGGLLLRFAGPKMTEDHGGQFLVPAALHHTARVTEGSLAWENAPKLKEFAASGPLQGLAIRDEITVRAQILADPGQDLEEKTWARLDDGTPLITAAALDKGLLVMVHTSASPEWSDLALSGTYVEILRRIVSLAGKPAAQRDQAGGILHPIWVLNGFGAVEKPGGTVIPVPAADFAAMPPGPRHPPGLYGHAGIEQAINTGAHTGTLEGVKNLPAGVARETYHAGHEFSLMPYLLLAALALLLFDWLVMIILMTELRLLARFAGLAVLLLCLPAQAQDKDMTYADGLYLAYMRTGNPAIDAASQQGLENLVAMLARRTSAEPDGVAALNPETDTLAFFPLIYWPVSETQAELSDTALRNVQDYLDHGGTILFDTRRPVRGNTDSPALRVLLGSLNIPPLAPIKKDHVLGRSFYLLDSFPGRYTGGVLWVESDSANGRDGVSSVIIGSNDYAGGWAEGNAGTSSFSGATRQHEMSYRFGVNLVMYALTGNYKADQVHVPHILERLGQ